MLEFIFIIDEQELQADSLTRVSSPRCLSEGVNTLYICLHLITELEIVTNQHLMHSTTLCVCVCVSVRARACTSFDKKIFRSFHAVMTDAPFCGCERVRFCFFRFSIFSAQCVRLIKIDLKVSADVSAQVCLEKQVRRKSANLKKNLTCQLV